MLGGMIWNYSLSPPLSLRPQQCKLVTQHRMDLMDHVRRPMVHGVKLHLPGVGGGTLEGSMCVTAFFLIYSTRKQEKEDEIMVLHTSIDRLEHKPGSNTAIMFLKDFRKFSLEFPSPEECQDMIDALEVLSQPEWLQQLHAFSYTPRVLLPESRWQFASVQELFTRWHCSEKIWRISQANKDFQLCSSYPEEAIVPLSSSDNDIRKAAAFRHLGRFPVLAFHHKKNQAVLVRCGQPLCGAGQKRCKEDIQMLNACLLSMNRGKILDIRSQSTAQSHMSKGGGMELPAHYPQWKVEHGRMEPSNNILTSLNKLMEACNDPSLLTSSSWFGRVEASGWLNHVSRLLNAVKFVSICIHRDASSVVVHGAGGRDASLQVTSLAQILLDSHCRTVEGFLELIQREWLDGGHPFSLRHTHVQTAPEREKSPMFLLFIDAVWQVMQQFPLSFEFNERLLHTLFVHSYYSVYGNFLYDTPKERCRQKLAENTQSLWAYLSQDEVLQPMLNPLYEKNSSVLLLTVHALNVTLWKRLYLRTDIEPSLSLPGYKAVCELKETNSQLRQTLNKVRRELEALQTDGRKFASNWS